MKYNRKWVGLGSAVLAIVITKQLLNSIGGIRNLPYLTQIFVVILCPILLSLVVKREKQKITDFQYKFLKVVVLFISAMTAMVNIIIILNNMFYDIWITYKELLICVTLGLFISFTIYVIAAAIIDIKKQNK